MRMKKIVKKSCCIYFRYKMQRIWLLRLVSLVNVFFSFEMEKKVLMQTFFKLIYEIDDTFVLCLKIRKQVL